MLTRIVSHARSVLNFLLQKEDFQWRTAEYIFCFCESLFDVRNFAESSLVPRWISVIGDTQMKQLKHMHSNSNNYNHEPTSPAAGGLYAVTGSETGYLTGQTANEDIRRPSDGSILEGGIMLASHNHDHELLPPSASGPASGKKGSNHYASGTLLRSKALFSSTPSLFSRPTPEEKFWKKEMKREKEEKKKMEEMRKKQEKEEKKNEKKRKKMEKKTATLNARSLRNYSHVARPIETVHMRPGLRMSVVSINYTDDQRIPPPHHPPPPPPPFHYAIPGVAVKGAYSSPAEMARVEQVYGTTHRRPAPPMTNSHYASPYGYNHTRFVFILRAFL